MSSSSDVTKNDGQQQHDRHLLCWSGTTVTYSHRTESLDLNERIFIGVLISSISYGVRYDLIFVCIIPKSTLDRERPL